MRIHYPVFALLSILIFAVGSTAIVGASSISSSSTPGSSSYTVSAQYSGVSVGSALSQSGTAPSPLSPALQAYNYNTQNALYLLTCPDAPVIPYASSQPDQYFYVSSSDFGDWHVAGNLCQAPSSAASLPVTAILNVYPNPVPESALPSTSSPSANVVLNFKNAMYTVLDNIGYSPELVSSTGNVVSSSFQTKSYIFNGEPIQGQEGLWTWVSRYIDLSTISQQLASGLGWTPVASEQLTYAPGGSCTYTYDLNSQTKLDSVQNTEMPFPGPAGGSINTDFLPYLLYDANITNTEPSNQFNTGLSLDLFSPQNYYGPQSSIEPVTVNSISLFFANTKNPGGTNTGNADEQLSYFESSGVNIDPYPIGQQLGLEVPYSVSTSSTTGGSGGTITTSNACPDQNFAGDQNSQLSLSQVVACAENAGFTGQQLLTFVSVAYAESSFYPGIVEGPYTPPGTDKVLYPYAEGILQEGSGCITSFSASGTQIPNCGPTLPGSQGFTLGNYNPSTCSTYASGSWLGIWDNPTCAFQWAYSYYQTDGYHFWGTTDYPTDQYCSFAPSSYSLPPSCSQGQNEIPSKLGSWTDVLNGLPSPGGASAPSSGSSSTTTTTTAAPSYTLPVTPISITSIPSGYIFALGSYSGTQTGTVSAGQCPTSTTGFITEGQYFSEAICAAGGGASNQEEVDFLAIWAYYQQQEYNAAYAGNPLLATQEMYNPLYFAQSSMPGYGVITKGTTFTPTTFTTSQDGIENTASVLKVRGDQYATSENSIIQTITSAGISSLLENAQADYVLTFDAVDPSNQGPPNQFYTDLKSLESSCAAGNCQIPSDIASQVNTQLNTEVSDGTPASPTTSAGDQYLQSATSTGLNLYVLQVVPSGYYNTSLYQPNSIQQSSSQQEYTTSWTDYWQNVAGLQRQDVYITNTISLSSSAVLNAMSTSTGSSLNPTSFSPANITSDNYGDIYMTGTDNNGNWWIVEVANTVGNGPIEVQAQPMCPPASSGVSGPTEACTGGQVWPEIAVAPTGSQVYLASYQSGYILEYDNDLAYTGYISLNFSASNVIYSGSTSYSFTSPTPGAPTTSNPPALNITDFLANGGLYGVTIDCGGKGQQTCTTADNTMKEIIANETNELQKYNPSGTGGGSATQDLLDKATWYSDTCKTIYAVYSTCNPNNNYHHPLAIQDVNGYLYVFDDWYGITGEVCTGSGTVLISGQKVCQHSAGGIAFNMPMIRVINSSGVDVPIDPTYYNDLWIPGTNQKTLMKYTQTSPAYYPPFGWILSANISIQHVPTGIQNVPTGNGQSLPYSDVCPTDSKGSKDCSSICPTGSTTCTQTPSTRNPEGIIYLNLCSGSPTSMSTTGVGCVQDPESGYPGSLKPVGPLVRSWNCLIDSCGGGPGVFPLVNIGFSVNYNYTVSLYVPSFTDVQQRGGVQDQTGSPSAFTNMQGELLIANINPQNYTRSVGGNSYPKVTYSCYTGQSQVSDGDSSIADNYQQNSECEPSKIVDDMYAPVYVAPNPFEYDSNIGSYQALAIDAVYSSVFSSSADLGSLVGGSNPNPSSTATQQKIQNEVTQLSSGYSSAYGTPPTGELQSEVSNPAALATSINSVISGYTLLPFAYTYDYKQWVSAIQPSSSGCITPQQLATLETPTTSTYTAYNYTTSVNNGPITASNAQPAQIESGGTYARSGLNLSTFYIANLTSVILPNDFLYNVLTNRIFGLMYANSTINAITNKQELINATNQYTYGLSTYSQDGMPGYQVFTATPIIPPCYKTSCASTLANTAQIFGVNNLFSTGLQSQLLVNLFNWYKLPVYDLALQLQLNGSSPKGNNAYGYHRLVFVYNDRFNNTLYMPLDVDIANTTAINMTLLDAVNSINANQTTIYINGTVGWTPPLSSNEIPLKSGFIYLYYQVNLNTIGYNAVVNPADAARCVFSNTTQPDNCALANPVYNGLEYNSLSTHYPDGSWSISPNVITYATAYNSMDECSPPPNSLLEPIGKIYTLCNIYSTQAASFSLPNRCPSSALGNTQYCYPLYENGTGICTPQLGLITIVPVNSVGGFSANVVACGSGTEEITAQYYGTPSPEPILASQSAIPFAADPQSNNYVTFNTFNYTWAPTSSSQITEIGALVLSLGQIAAVPVIVVLGVAALVVAALRSRRKGKMQQYRKRK